MKTDENLCMDLKDVWERIRAVPRFEWREATRSGNRGRVGVLSFTLANDMLPCWLLECLEQLYGLIMFIQNMKIAL